MSILKANLKHLYQRRGLWFVYAIILMSVPALISKIVMNEGTDYQKGLFVVVFILSNVVGLFVCSMQIDIAVKPFSHCLPGHRRVKRQILFAVAVTTSLLFSLIFLLYPNVTVGDKLMAVFAAFFAGMTSFWIGVLIAFTGNYSAAALGVYPIIGIIASKYDLHIALESSIIVEPGIVCVVGIVASILAWTLLASEGWFRRHCGADWIGFIDIWNWGKVRKFSSKRYGKLNGSVLPGGFERLCLERIKNTSMRIQRYFAGVVYETFGGLYSSKISCFVSMFLLLLIGSTFGYFKGAGIMVFLIPAGMLVNMRMPIHSTLLIAGGRRERYFSTCFLAIVSAVLLCVIGLLIAMATHAFAATQMMRPITVIGNLSQYSPISPLGFYVPFIIVPVGFTLMLVFKRKQIPLMVSWVLFIVPFAILLAFVDLRNIWWACAVASIIATCWVVFLGVLWWICMRRSLVI